MRVALITETFLPNVNGVVTTLCRVLEHIQEQGHEAILFAPQGAPQTYAGTEIIPLGGIPLPLYPELNVTPPQFGITARLREFQPDVIHLVAPAILGSMVPVLAQNLHIPLLSSYHTDLVAYSKHYGLGIFQSIFSSYLRWIHNHSRITLCPSTATLHDLRSQGFRRLKVWGRGVDTQRFHPNYRDESWRLSVGAAPEDRVLLYVGRIGKEKRLDLLEQATCDMEHVRLVIVGDGPARPELEKRMQHMPVTFTGYLKGHDLATAYASADMFVFPSDTETFGQVVQEAMASGLPVVGARSGGTIDLVREGVTGALFEPGIATDLRTQLSQILLNPDRLYAMGKAGRIAAERRSWRSVLNELMQHYHRLLRRTPPQKHLRKAA
jgi:glycosyltransferase involved in cell wall biosynthesis